MNNVNYSFTKLDEGNIVFRSHVKSFGLDHITDKDITSFYLNFSNHLAFDTGLLPVDGSGLLSIRTAGPCTQIAYQHAPGMYYVNWGQYEGDANAIKYYVAQPYRIIIADLLDGNIHGARTFYSPYPITYPNAPLYHVNLPNINCKGYRGNGVGWICLYHREDISKLPFNEKLAKVIERCSGVEAYNDNNMSETDGPRFYQDHNKPSRLSHPSEWEDYSRINGYEWTLDPDLWIPVLVKDKDNQDKHYSDGQPLTFADALLGNYKSYYQDDNIPKPFNKIAREDYSLSSQEVSKWFISAYNQSLSEQPTVDPYSSSIQHRVTLATTEQFHWKQEQSEEDDSPFDWYCTDCDEGYTDDDDMHSTYSSNSICSNCFESYVYAYNTQSCHHQEEEIIYLSHSDIYIYLNASHLDYKYCPNCDSGMYANHPDYEQYITYPIGVCTDCGDPEELKSLSQE